MKKHPLLAGTVLSLFLSLAFIGLTYAGNGLAKLAYLPFDAFDFAARTLPGAVVNFGIDLMVRIITGLQLGPTALTAKLAEQSIAIVQFLVMGAVFGLVVTAVARRRAKNAVQTGVLGGLVLWLLMLGMETSLGFPALTSPILSAIWLLGLCAAWGWLLGEWARLSLLPAEEVTYSASRRRFLSTVGGGSLLVLLGGVGLARLLQESVASVPTQPASGAGSLLPTPTALAPLEVHTNGPAASPPLATLQARFQPVPGTRAEITPTSDFYRIDINVGVPTTDINTWRCSVEGLVDKPMLLSIDQLRAYPSLSQAVTLECISNPLGGDLTSTAVFSGVPLKTVLAEAGLHSDATWIDIEAFDGFYESLSLTEAMDDRTILVYDMNGAPLTPNHGSPLRIYIPNHYGMKQPKWIERIHVADHQGPGYWVDRGWSATAIPQTTSVIDTVAIGSRDPQTKTVPVGGIAYAGARGISKVEVQVDGGPWTAVELRLPPLSPLTWVQWRYAMPDTPGQHTLRVRAYDGTGKLQTEEASDTLPNGATGLFTYSAVL